MSYPIAAIDDIDADDAKALKSLGIRTAEKLLEAAKSPKGRKLLTAETGLDGKRLLRWANIADKLRIKGGVFEGRFMDPVGVKVLSQMPSKPELQAKLLAMINAPATQLLRTIQEPGAQMVRLLESLRKSKAE